MSDHPVWLTRSRKSRRFRGAMNRELRGAPLVVPKSECSQERKARPCCVYVLVHAHEERFKIGLNIEPLARLMQLPEARVIDMKASLMLRLPSERSARRVEKTLHRALDDFRVRVFDAHGGVWPGGTEWFELAAFMHAVDLLRHMPKGRTQETLRLQYLDGSAVEDDFFSWKSAVSERDLRREEAARENVTKMRTIQRLLKTLMRHCKCTWVPAKGASTDALGRATAAQPERLLIHGIRNLWEVGAISARVAINATDLWMFRTGKRRQWEKSQTMVSLIRYNQDSPTTLEFHVVDRQIIRQWPGAKMILRIWRETVGG